MKTFDVTLTLYHESYNGYDLCDGKETYTVQARNPESAIKKARKLKPKHCWATNASAKEK